MYYIYLLRCTDGTIYTGIATDLSRRIREHRSGICPHSKYTRAHTPDRVCAAWKSSDRASASRLEYRLKRLRKIQKENLAQGEDLSSVFSDQEFCEAYLRLPPEEFDV
ncbi:MAG: GIY-YIG nuclease family protein [Clostridia bacterium]|nr:GIY-YIG nuclease family protein [Clostridia bacterium]